MKHIILYRFLRSAIAPVEMTTKIRNLIPALIFSLSYLSYSSFSCHTQTVLPFPVIPGLFFLFPSYPNLIRVSNIKGIRSIQYWTPDRAPLVRSDSKGKNSKHESDGEEKKVILNIVIPATEPELPSFFAVITELNSVIQY